MVDEARGSEDFEPDGGVGAKGRVIVLAAVAVYLVAAVIVRFSRPEEGGEADFEQWVGATAADVVGTFGQPASVEEDGSGGRVVRYDRYRLAEDRIVMEHLSLYLSEDGRVYDISLE